MNSRITMPYPYPLTTRDLHNIPGLAIYIPGDYDNHRVWSRRRGWGPLTQAVVGANGQHQERASAGQHNRPPHTTGVDTPLGEDVWIPGKANVPATGQWGFVRYDAVENLVPAAQYRNFNDAAWIKTGGDVPNLNIPGVDGLVRTQQISLRALAANATFILDLGVIASQDYQLSYMMRALNVTGAVEISLDGGATWTDISSEIRVNAFSRVRLNQTLANPDIGIRIVDIGDEIVVDWAQLRGGSTVFEAGLLVPGGETRVRDQLNVDIADLGFDGLQGTILATVVTYHNKPSGDSYTIFAIGAADRIKVVWGSDGSGIINYSYRDNNVNQCNLSAGPFLGIDVPVRIGCTWQADRYTMFANGREGVEDLSGTVVATMPDPFQIGVNEGGTSQAINGEVGDIMIFDRVIDEQEARVDFESTRFWQ